MPPHETDCSGTVMYIRDDSGRYVRLDQLSELREADGDMYDGTVLHRFSESAMLTATLTHRSARRIRKMVMKAKNRRYRDRRRYFRMKEKHRRILLKASGKPQTVFWKGNANEDYRT